VPYDLVIRGGRIVDGSGRPPFSGDVAISGRSIAEVGKVTARGRRELAADGATITPGFVDIHTHYDGQATWADRLQPSSWHGVTTTVSGNCGVGFAPVHADDHDRLIELMEGVEDIPQVVLREGLRWDWESFPEYLDRLAARTFDLDVAMQVPHAAVRVYVMRERAAARRSASAAEIVRMSQIVKDAVRAGALGFSSSRALNHKTIAGELTPSYGAGAAELAAIAAAVGQTGTGVIQFVSDSFLSPGSEAEFLAEKELLLQLIRASRRPVSFTLTQRSEDPSFYRRVLTMLTEVNAGGETLRAQVAPRGIGILLGLPCTLHPFMMNPVWRGISHLPVAEQARAMAQPAFKSKLLAAQTPETEASLLGGLRIHRWHTMTELTDPPDYEPSPTDSIAAVAAAAGESPAEVAYRIMLKDGGNGLIYMPLSNYADGSLDAVREMLVHDFTVPGLSDGGAHVGTICDGSFSTTLLQYWARGRSRETIDLAFLVQRQARDTARAVGLCDRGELRPGLKADLNVIDLDGLRLRKPQAQYDLPGGGRRLVQRADGYLHTFVSGVETYADGTATGALPGRLVRGARAAGGRPAA
jgi:N-acyl-D-aspartate/D-glutamate deacylase